MRHLTMLALAGLSVMGSAQGMLDDLSEATRPIRIRVRHADPWAVKAMLEGMQITSPEISTVMAIIGAPQGMLQGTGKPWFANGKLIVNPTDNSIWFFPDKKG